MMGEIGKLLIVMGFILILIGVIFVTFYSHDFPLFKYLGKLPGDIYIEKENFKFYFPLTTSILLSIILSLLLYLFAKLR